jgi:hypothetical protein
MKGAILFILGLLIPTILHAQTVNPPIIPPNNGPPAGVTYNIAVYGANPNASPAVNGVAFQKAFTAAAAGTAIFIPCGTYTISASPVAYLTGGASFTMRGSGEQCTNLVFQNVNGPQLILTNFGNSFDLEDFSIQTTAAGSYTGISISQADGYTDNYGPVNVVKEVNFQGSDFISPSANSNYWTTAFTLQGVANTNFYGGVCNQANPASAGSFPARGTCYSMQGYTPGISCNTYYICETQVVNFFGTIVNQCNVGFYYGNYVEGVTLTNVNATGCNYAVQTGTGTGVAYDQLTITGGQFNCFQICVDIETAQFAALNISGAFFDPLFGGSGTREVLKLQGQTCNITGNRLAGNNNQTAVLLVGMTSDCKIAHNSIVGFNSAFTAPNNASLGYTSLDYNNFVDYTGTVTDYTIGTGVTGLMIHDDFPRNTIGTSSASKLPSCVAGINYSKMMVGDASVTTYNANYVNGGAAVFQVKCIGTTWQLF